MRRLPLIVVSINLAVASLPLAAEPPAVRLSEPVAVEAGAETFGGEIPSTPRPLALADVVADASDYLERDVIVSARIGKVCQKKGCFFIARDGDAIVRVTFRDYAFFIPTDAGGKRAVFRGMLKRATVSTAEAEHYARDLGNAGDPGIAAGPAYAFVAAAIRIEG